MKSFSDYLPQYLSAYWLRPITAVVRSLESEVLKLDQQHGKKTLELACGDGMNGYLAMGGEVPFDFDVFQSMPVPTPEQFFSGRVDVYNTFEPKAQPQMGPQRDNYWTKGIDHKQALVDKAATTGGYKNLECRDLNKGLDPSEEGYDFIFSNSLYWVKNVEPLLQDMHRALKDGGLVKLSLVRNTFIDKMAWSVFKDYSFREYMDGSRHTHFQHLETDETWEKRFTAAGFKIADKTPTFNDKLVHMIEMHDYREISPITNLMARKLSREDYVEAKRHWIDYALFIYNKMHAEGFFKATPGNNNYNIYTLQK